MKQPSNINLKKSANIMKKFPLALCKNSVDILEQFTNINETLCL